MCAQIIPQKAKPLSSFTNEEGMKLLMGPTYQEAETKPLQWLALTNQPDWLML